MKKRRKTSGTTGELALQDHAWGQFERSLKMMADYIAEHGHSYPYDRHLNEFATRMRRAYATGQLDVDREMYLRRIGFDFTVKRGFRIWYRRYLEFKKYWEKRSAPASCKLYDTDMPVELRRWIAFNRVKRNQGKLSRQREALLDALHVDWQPFATAWDKNYSALVAYLKRTKSREIPPRETPEGLWLDSQRTKYTAGRLSADRTARLRALGLDLNPILDKRKAILRAVVDFRKKHGHARIPMRSRSPERDALMKWVRRQYRSGELAPTLQEQLNALEFAWEAPDHDAVVKDIRDNQHLPRSQRVWDRRIRDLRDFVRTHKRLPRHVDDPKERTLHAWITRIKPIITDPDHSMHSFYTRERRRMLSDLGVTFSKKRSRT